MTRSPALRRFPSDGRGVAIVEFALLAPLLILFYVGMVELVQGLMAERKTAHAASAIGDLVAQAQQVTPAEVDSIFQVAEVVLSPYPTGEQLEVRVSSVKVGANGVARVIWSDAQNCDARNGGAPNVETDGEIISLPKVTSADGTTKDFLQPGQSAVMAEVNYTFETPFSDLFVAMLRHFGSSRSKDSGGFSFSSTFYLQPRQSAAVTYKTT